MEYTELIPQISALIIYMGAELTPDWKYGSEVFWGKKINVIWDKEKYWTYGKDDGLREKIKDGDIHLRIICINCI